jgi:hypothetical protein
MTIEHAIEFAESGTSTGGDETHRALTVLARAARERGELLEKLELAMSWIDNWSPSFIYDPELGHDAPGIRAAIAKTKGAA